MNNIIKVFTKSPNRIDNILLFLQTPRADQKSNAHWTACFLIETDLSGRRKSLVYISLQRKYFEKLPRRCGRRFIMCSLLPPPFVFHTSNLCSSFFWHFQSSRHPIKMRARATVHKKVVASIVDLRGDSNTLSRRCLPPAFERPRRKRFSRTHHARRLLRWTSQYLRAMATHPHAQMHLFGKD